MDYFVELDIYEQDNINGGGVLSAIAGGLAGAMIGTIVALIPAAITRDASYITKAATAGGSIGVWVGAGCPLP